jgi:glycosyltransferase involved in cell wall biosynthesis
MINTIKQYGICNLKKVVEIHNAVDKKLTEEDKFSSTSRIFIFLNSFREMRNVDLLIKAFYYVCKKYPDALLYLIGSTLELKGYTPTSKKYELMLRDLVNELNLNDNVKFYPFSLNPWQRVKNGLAFVLPADIIWLNFALLEAMAYGIVPIVVNGEGADRIIKDGVNGLIAEKNAESLASKMIFALENPRQMELMSIEAKNYIKKYFTVDNIVEKIIRTYFKEIYK